MPDRIIPRRSWSSGSVPIVATDISAAGEILVNWPDAKLFTKDLSGNLISISLGGGGGGGNSSIVSAATVAGFPSSGSASNLYVATDTRKIYGWDSSGVYVELGPVGGSGSTSAFVSIPQFGDADYANVSLLLHGNGSTADTGPLALTGTATSVATNGAPKYGTASLSFGGSSRLVYANNAAWNFPADFTVEAWVYPTIAIGSGEFNVWCLAAQWSGSGGLCWLWYLRSNGFSVGLGNGSPVGGFDHNSATIVPNQWHHVALVRSNGVISSYLNGSRFGTFSSSLDLSGTGLLTIGDQGDSVIRPFTGLIDEFRITKNVARYTGDSYTVPATQFPDGVAATFQVTFV